MVCRIKICNWCKAVNIWFKNVIVLLLICRIIHCILKVFLFIREKIPQSDAKELCSKRSRRTNTIHRNPWKPCFISISRIAELHGRRHPASNTFEMKYYVCVVFYNYCMEKTVKLHIKYTIVSRGFAWMYRNAEE